ncbi:aminotransferase class I/II-fold pyridoxal phosphate-dependent enzyme [Pontibacter qinzhouensis]|uniref:Aminotransferase class I/II-fold pyridoxal phosphate-dependent enzyme n=1 Tax=Pontibacter qinzhouensis TaxID=2603253 RepID=A0A5C8K8B6_9BACT|nr:aminotransferase class I/II-fold pyridoxal phosphate-dependent enzyme [Pontibacter qinzhouensis]TXK45900.1 aminotransferase class I/II-fold pyridoxal phosphate-dependent enzyme [Pontibacter qinzhouensis]
MAQFHPKVTPIYQTSVFTFEDLNELESYFEQPGNQYMYSRFGNPNTDELAAEVSKLEGGAGAVVTSSGMSAILVAVLTYCQAGDHVLCAEEIYGGSATLLSQELTRIGIAISFVPGEQLYTLSNHVQPNTKMVLAETISNPLLQVLDINRLAEETKQANIKLVIDNTFASPVITKPLALGADMVMHSVTKYLSGHSDVTAGVVVCQEQDLQRAKQVVMTFGVNLSPFESWLAARGLKTLKLRIRQHSQNALAIAQFLQQHPKVEQVWYPGLEQHEQHLLAKEQGNGLFGGMLSFRIQDKLETVNAFMQALQQMPFAPSLAGVSTSISHPLRTSHRSFTPERLDKLGITLGVIRLSVGIEEAEELIADLGQALEKI